ncbi:TetR/AcrR family transcriptional regulator [Xylophilus sp.]|uniref:TetR/AcrR family transcriptional regulator n=1 Tax=Xylophilus sp. TaxID=2653893 RepID=UPI0013B5BF86|nr:TetR/AcrR family transcriptional regulator [Xylophilus sp.]KAF1046216.1 MAG: hypothetical protein GAK38_02613 [Xylophilus sp.]
MSSKKAPRRTAQRIQEAALELFNRFGEPGVSTTLLASELRISPGNLYYHYPAKDALINALFDRHAAALAPLLAGAAAVRCADDAWAHLQGIARAIWACRFLYRNLGDLVARNRYLETGIQALLARQDQSAQALVAALAQAGALRIDPAAARAVAANLVVLQTSWLCLAYVRDPRHALEPEAGPAAVHDGALRALALLAPWFAAAEQPRLGALLASPDRDGVGHRPEYPRSIALPRAYSAH